MLMTTAAVDEKWICDASNEFCFVPLVHEFLGASADLHREIRMV